MTLKTGKYSSELKQLDINEMLHVVDYAILMGYAVRLEYRGSPGVKRGAYAVQPVEIERGPNPALLGESVGTQSRRRFLLREVDKLGVEEE